MFFFSSPNTPEMCAVGNQAIDFYLFFSCFFESTHVDVRADTVGNEDDWYYDSSVLIKMVSESIPPFSVYTALTPLVDPTSGSYPDCFFLGNTINGGIS